MKQKYITGDHVMVVKDLGPWMNDFESDCEAIVLDSYAGQFGGDDTGSYTLHIKGLGEVSGYGEDQFDLINHNCIDLLTKWEIEAEQGDSLKTIRNDGKNGSMQ